MKQKLTSRELQTQLAAKNEAIKARIDALQGEVATTGDAVRHAVSKNPFVGVGAAVVGGLAVGLLFGGRRRKKVLFDSEQAHRALIDRYVKALAEDVRYRVRSGKDVGEAVDVALRDRLPLIVYAPDEPSSNRGVVRQVVDIVVKTAIGFGVKMAIDLITAQLDVVALQEEFTMQTEGEDGTETSTATFTEEFSRTADEGPQRGG